MNHYPITPYSPAAGAVYPHTALPIAGAQQFLTGFLLTACLTALQDKPDLQRKTVQRRILRRSLQGGAALSAASASANAAVRGDYTHAVVAASVGAVGVYLLEQLLQDTATTTPSQEHING